MFRARVAPEYQTVARARVALEMILQIRLFVKLKLTKRARSGPLPEIGFFSCVLHSRVINPALAMRETAPGFFAFAREAISRPRIQHQAPHQCQKCQCPSSRRCSRPRRPTRSRHAASKLSAERAARDGLLHRRHVARHAGAGRRSRAVSTDVADTIEGLMPALMEIFCGPDDVVRFEPVGPEDVAAAEQETDYVNHVFMQVNPGFLILYSFIKDALLSKVGVVKVWWEEREEEKRETYLRPARRRLRAARRRSRGRGRRAQRAARSRVPVGRDGSGDAFADVFAAPAGEPAAPPVPAPTRHVGYGCALAPATATPAPTAPAPSIAAPEDDYAPGPMLHDVTVVTRKTLGQAHVQGVPPEEFGISRNARTLRDCDYCFHEVIKRAEDLIAEGYDRDEIERCRAIRCSPTRRRWRATRSTSIWRPAATRPQRGQPADQDHRALRAHGL